MFFFFCSGCWILRKSRGQTMRSKWVVRCFRPGTHKPTVLKNQRHREKNDGTSWHQMFEGELSRRLLVLHKGHWPSDICAMASASPISSSALSRSCTNKLQNIMSHERCFSQMAHVLQTVLLDMWICSVPGFTYLHLVKVPIQAWERPILHL